MLTILLFCTAAAVTHLSKNVEITKAECIEVAEMPLSQCNNIVSAFKKSKGVIVILPALDPKKPVEMMACQEEM